jgi:hypothetical protein
MSPDKSAVEMFLRLMALAARTAPKSFTMDCLEVQIVAVGWIGDTYHGFLLTPVPEPSTMLLLGSGLIGLAGYGRKKFFKK